MFNVGSKSRPSQTTNINNSYTNKIEINGNNNNVEQTNNSNISQTTNDPQPLNFLDKIREIVLGFICPT